MKIRGKSPIDVSFAVASFNSGQYLEDCVKSALAQQDVTCEVIIVDDGSTDGSDTIASRLAQDGERVKFFRTPENRGPGGARNIALQQMEGEWFAVLDSDDLLDPARSARLLKAANTHDAEIVADDLVLFGQDMAEERFLENSTIPGSEIDLDTYFRESALYGGTPNPGFLKPMISRKILERTGVRYDESLRVAEDDDLIIRLLMAGAKYYVCPEAGYRYRKHEQSISYRLAPKHALAMGERAKSLEKEMQSAGLASNAFRIRQNAMRNGVSFTLAIDAIKAGKPFSALSEVLRNPGSIRLFSMPIKARLSRIFAR